MFDKVRLGLISLEIERNLTLSHKFLDLILFDYWTNRTQSFNLFRLSSIEFDYRMIRLVTSGLWYHNFIHLSSLYTSRVGFVSFIFQEVLFFVPLGHKQLIFFLLDFDFYVMLCYVIYLFDMFIYLFIYSILLILIILWGLLEDLCWICTIQVLLLLSSATSSTYKHHNRNHLHSHSSNFTHLNSPPSNFGHLH